jgi:hypothetical protein
MPDQRGWPDAANPGTPESPEQEGPHLIQEDHGDRRWYWWLPNEAAWFGHSQKHEPSFAAVNWSYIGAAAEPTKRASFQTQVNVLPSSR